MAKGSRRNGTASHALSKTVKDIIWILAEIVVIGGGLLNFWTSSYLDEPTKYFAITLLILAGIIYYMAVKIMPRIKDLEEGER